MARVVGHVEQVERLTIGYIREPLQVWGPLTFWVCEYKRGVKEQRGRALTLWKLFMRGSMQRLLILHTPCPCTRKTALKHNIVCRHHWRKSSPVAVRVWEQSLESICYSWGVCVAWVLTKHILAKLLFLHFRGDVFILCSVAFICISCCISVAVLCKIKANISNFFYKQHKQLLFAGVSIEWCDAHKL